MLYDIESYLDNTVSSINLSANLQPPISISIGGKGKGFTEEKATEIDISNDDFKSCEVYAFRTEEEIRNIIGVLDAEVNLAKTNEKALQARRNKLLFLCGINLGLRASDLSRIKWRFFYTDNTFKEWNDSYKIMPQKTKRYKKSIEVYFNSAVKKAVEEYKDFVGASNVDLDSYVFTSQKGGAMTTRTLWNIIKTIAQKAGIKQNIGSHSLRKTWGYWVYHQAEDKENALVMLQECFNHSSTRTTLRYIGLLSEDKKAMYESVNLGGIDD